MKKISKIVTFVFALSMVLGLGMMEEAKAAIDPSRTTHICLLTGEECEETLGGSFPNYVMECSKGHVATKLDSGGSIVTCCSKLSEPDTPGIENKTTDIDLQNSVESVQYDTLNKTEGTDHFSDETTNIWANGQIVEEVRVKVDVESAFTITIPKEIVLDGDTKRASYTVNVQGDIAGDQLITVQPDASFDMVEAGGKANVTATVSQTGLTFPYMSISPVNGTSVDGYVEALDLTAGTWSGKFNFNITFGENNE